MHSLTRFVKSRADLGRLTGPRGSRKSPPREAGFTGYLGLVSALPAPNQSQVPPDDERVSLDRISLDHDEELSYFEASGCGIAGASARGVTAEAGSLTEVDLSGCSLDAGRFTDLDLVRCDLSNSRSRAANLTRVRFAGCRPTGLSLTDSVLHDVIFRECRVDLSNFALSRLNRVAFEDCQLSGVSLMEARCDAVRFTDCRMTDSDLRGASLKGCEFVRTDLSGVDGIEGLRGARMEWTDIIDHTGVWAAALGIEVISPEDEGH